MPLSTAAWNAMLDHLAGLATWFSLHTADPGAGGANEVSGGSPAYARKQGVWDPASAKVLSLDGTPLTFDVPGGVTVNNVGIWSASTAGTFYGSGSVTPEAFGGQATYQLNDVDVTGS